MNKDPDGNSSLFMLIMCSLGGTAPKPGGHPHRGSAGRYNITPVALSMWEAAGRVRWVGSRVCAQTRAAIPEQLPQVRRQDFREEVHEHVSCVTYVRVASRQ